jgi:AraC family transcriptional regulator
VPNQSLTLSVQEVGAADQSLLSLILCYDMVIAPVCEYIEVHLDDRLTLAEVARVACFSPYHFSRSFKQAVGVGPHCYVIQRRLERVKTLMRRTNQSLTLIANEARFSDQSHLEAIFRRETGETPGRYRAAARRARHPADIAPR